MVDPIADIIAQFHEQTARHDRKHKEQADEMRALWHVGIDRLSNEQLWRFHESAVAILDRVMAE
jgi:hypothetical protein